MLHEATNGLKPRHRAGSTNHLVWHWLPSGPSRGTKDATTSVGSAEGGAAIWLLQDKQLFLELLKNLAVHGVDIGRKLFYPSRPIQTNANFTKNHSHPRPSNLPQVKYEYSECRFPARVYFKAKKRVDGVDGAEWGWNVGRHWC
jgi:hypothetical protein